LTASATLESWEEFTMRISFVRRVALAVTLAVAASSGTDLRAHPPSINTDLNRLAWLVGTWKGDGRTPDGQPATNTFTFEWTPSRTAFKYTIDRTAGGVTVPALVGLCTWHPAKSAFVLLEVSDRGEVTDGVLRIHGDRYAYEETISGSDGTVLPVRAEAVREGDDAFVFRASVQQGGDWKVVFETTWRRVRH
jgi:hypothetical protein